MPTHSYDVLPLLHTYVSKRLSSARRLDPSAPIVTARLSATVVLVRNGRDGLETYLLQRHARMAFAPRMAVFPGGAVEPSDGMRRAEADRLRACGVRETHEETGVDLDPELLRPWAHWTTPEPEPIRYDTAFFVAACPVEQEPANVSGEADSARWWLPPEAVSAYELGILNLMPPTLSVLLELAGATDVDGVLERAESRVVEPVLPCLELDADGRVTGIAYPTRGNRV